MDKEITIIGLDGINRVGKGTQISLLAEYITEYIVDSLVFIARGDGTRKGLGNQVSNNAKIITFDPHSEFRDVYYKLLKMKVIAGENDIEGWRLASERIQRELFILIHRTLPGIQKNQKKKIFLLLDRTILSRRFLELQQKETLNYDAFVNLGTKAHYNQMIVPDVIFYFYAELDILIKRFSKDELKTDQGKFRKQIILSHHKIFTDLIKNDNIPQEIKEKITIINSGKLGIEEVFAKIISTLKEQKFLPNDF